MTEEPQYVKITPEPNEFERAVILKAFKQLWPKDEKPPISYKWRSVSYTHLRAHET